jgi:ATP-dependent exoDNAse (exonuclease V) beta subunit
MKPFGNLPTPGTNKDKYIRRIRLAITCFDEAVIHTIHGFCNRVLAENSLETHALFEAELDQSTDDLITEAMHEYWRCSMADVHPVVAASASVSRLGPDELVKFYKSLPVTRSFQMGFGQGEDPALFREQLILGFETA